MNSSFAASIDSSALVRNAPAVSSAELSIKIARRCGPPKKLAGPPPPTIPTRNLRRLIMWSPQKCHRLASGHYSHVAGHRKGRVSVEEARTLVVRRPLDP